MLATIIKIMISGVHHKIYNYNYKFWRAAGVELGLLTARGGVKRRSGVWRERQERDSASRKCSAFEVAPHCVATSASVRAGMGSGWSFRSMNSERASSGSRISGGVDGETKAAFPTTSARSRRGLGEVSAKSRRVSVGQSRLERCDYLPTSPHHLAISRHISRLERCDERRARRAVELGPAGEEGDLEEAPR